MFPVRETLIYVDPVFLSEWNKMKLMKRWHLDYDSLLHHYIHEL